MRVRRGIVMDGLFAPDAVSAATPLQLPAHDGNEPARAWEVDSWAEFLGRAGVPAEDCAMVGRWMDGVMGTRAAGVPKGGEWPPCD